MTTIATACRDIDTLRADNERMGRKCRLIELILFTTERKLSYAEMDELDDLHKEFVK